MKRMLGYARVSSSGQNVSRQIDAIKRYVPEENIIADKASGVAPLRYSGDKIFGPFKQKQTGDETGTPVVPES